MSIAEKLLGRTLFRTLRSIRRVANAKERRRPAPLMAKMWGWPRGFRGQSVLLYGREGIRAGDFLSDSQMENECHRLNPVADIFQRKYLLYNYLSLRGIRQPDHVALIWNLGVLAGVNDTAHFISVEELRRQLVEQGGSYILKPEAGGRGEGIQMIEVRDNRLITMRGASERETFLHFGPRDVHLLQRRVEQHSWWQTLAPGSLNTMRIHTMWTPGDSAPFIAYAVQRIGTRATAPTDNWSGGGLMAQIDLATGTMDAANFQPLREHTLRPSCTHHPESNAQILNAVVPHWDDIKRFTLEAASCIPFNPYIAWDIAMNAAGEPLVIEGNAYPGLSGIQSHQGLLSMPQVKRFYEKTGVLAG